jgi:hypothetical protein
MKKSLMKGKLKTDKVEQKFPDTLFPPKAKPKPKKK